MVRAKVVTVMRWHAQDEVNQEESEHNEFDGMKKGVDSTGKVVMTAASITNQMSGDPEDAMFTGSDFSSMRTPDNVTKRLKTWYFMVQCLGILQPIRKIIFAVFTLPQQVADFSAVLQNCVSLQALLSSPTIAGAEQISSYVERR